MNWYKIFFGKENTFVLRQLRLWLLLIPLILIFPLALILYVWLDQMLEGWVTICKHCDSGWAMVGSLFVLVFTAIAVGVIELFLYILYKFIKKRQYNNSISIDISKQKVDVIEVLIPLLIIVISYYYWFTNFSL